MRRPGRALALFLIAIAAAMPAGAAEPTLRVRGQATLDATAGWLDGHVIVSGSVRDDTGRPLPGAAIKLRAHELNGASARLPDGAPCSPR